MLIYSMVFSVPKKKTETYTTEYVFTSSGLPFTKKTENITPKKIKHSQKKKKSVGGSSFHNQKSQNSETREQKNQIQLFKEQEVIYEYKSNFSEQQKDVLFQSQKEFENYVKKTNSQNHDDSDMVIIEKRYRESLFSNNQEIELQTQNIQSPQIEYIYESQLLDKEQQNNIESLEHIQNQTVKLKSYGTNNSRENQRYNEITIETVTPPQSPKNATETNKKGFYSMSYNCGLTTEEEKDYEGDTENNINIQKEITGIPKRLKEKIIINNNEISKKEKKQHTNFKEKCIYQFLDLYIFFSLLIASLLSIKQYNNKGYNEYVNAQIINLVNNGFALIYKQKILYWTLQSVYLSLLIVYCGFSERITGIEYMIQNSAVASFDSLLSTALISLIVKQFDVNNLFDKKHDEMTLMFLTIFSIRAFMGYFFYFIFSEQFAKKLTSGYWYSGLEFNEKYNFLKFLVTLVLISFHISSLSTLARLTVY